MSWLIKYRKKDNKYRIWTTISDGWITDWLTRNEILIALEQRGQMDTKLNAIEQYLTFPAGWYDKDTRKPLSLDKSAFYDWQRRALSKGDVGYEAEIDKKYNEIIKELSAEL